MKRLTGSAIALVLSVLLIAGCGSNATTACEPVGSTVTVCLNGKPVDFSAEKNKPHKHETGNLYAPAATLGSALGVKVETDVTAVAASVNGKQVELKATDVIKGVHVHDGVVFVPLKEFASVAGLKLDLNYDKGTAGFAK